MTATIQLFYLPDKALVNFQIQAFESHEHIIQNIRQHFGVPFVAVFTQDAKRQPVDLSNVLEGTILLVTTAAIEHPQPYAPPGFKLYRGEETGFVHPSMQGKPWDWLDEIGKRNHIVSLGTNRPETKNILRIAVPYPAIEAELAALGKVDAMQLAITYSLAASHQKISNNWGMPFMLWLPEELKPKGSLVSYLPMGCHISKGILETIVDAQTNVGVPTKQDVMQAITSIYERAGMVALQMTKAEKDKIKERERQKKRKGRNRAAAKAKVGRDEMEELGEDAAEAADPKGLWTRKDGDDVDDLADKLGGTRTSRAARRTYTDDTESE